MSKRGKKLLLGLGITLVIVLLASSFYFGMKSKPKIMEPKVQKTIPGFGYKLLDNHSKVYRSYFNELYKVLTKDEVDEEAYAKLVVKLFVADFYDLDSADSNEDIGGTQFILPEVLDNFKLNAKNTLYKEVENRLVNKRTQELPRVATVTVDNIKPSKYTFDKKLYIVEINDK